MSQIDPYIGELLKKWRLEAGLAIFDISKALGVDGSYISMIERAKRKASLNVIEGTGRACSRSLEEIDALCIRRGLLPSWLVDTLMDSDELVDLLRDSKREQIRCTCKKPTLDKSRLLRDFLVS